MKLALPKFSVRARITAIALIPVVGFIANGMTFSGGGSEVAGAFAEFKRAADISEASHRFKDGVATMRMSARDFLITPTEDIVNSYGKGLTEARDKLKVVNALLPPAARKEFAGLSDRLNLIQKQFNFLVDEQRILGFSDDDGLRRNLRMDVSNIELLINSGLKVDNVTVFDPADVAALNQMLLSMRRYQAEYAADRRAYLPQLFLSDYEKFQKQLAGANATPAAKKTIGTIVKSYADTFSIFVANVDKIDPTVSYLDLETQSMLPVADRIIASIDAVASSSSAALSRSQTRTKAEIIGVGVLAIFIGLGFSWLIGRGITAPLERLAAAMKQLAGGDTAVEIPASRSDDEIGVMSRTVIVFRDSMIERQRLAREQAQAGRAREQRSDVISSRIAHFEVTVEQTLANLRNTSQHLEHAAADLHGAADAVSAEAKTAETRVDNATENVAAAASSVEELAASISEIATQATRSKDVASAAVAEGSRTARTMADLSRAASRIGEVVGLIQSIAGQTNLLALNATIEAARAGEAGRGFSVVAAEVKTLAGQTAKATHDVAEQIATIQAAAVQAVSAIEQVNSIIESISEISSTVAATVEEQSSAVQIIAEGVSLASSEARDGSEAMSRVAGSSMSARMTASDVKALADTLALAAQNIETEVRQFLHEVQAA